jgi:hypothetical protein
MLDSHVIHLESPICARSGLLSGSTTFFQVAIWNALLPKGKMIR